MSSKDLVSQNSESSLDPELLEMLTEVESMCHVARRANVDAREDDAWRKSRSRGYEYAREQDDYDAHHGITARDNSEEHDLRQVGDDLDFEMDAVSQTAERLSFTQQPSFAS